MTDLLSPSPVRRPVWRALEAHARRLRGIPVESLFAADRARHAALCLRHDGLLVDFSKQRLDLAARDALLALSNEAGLTEAVQALFAGAALNFTEGRAALHMALRGSCPVPSADAAELHETARRVRDFVSGVRSGALAGATGKRFDLVVNLGIGGSDLGPRLLVEALAPIDGHAQLPQVRFVANVDPRELDQALAGADPHTTLFILSSKSFTTAETLANARAARAWLRAGLGPDVDLHSHFAAVTNAIAAPREFGIAPERVFHTPEWIGGRYSVWSATGLPAMIALGPERFERFLAGGRGIDTHFRDAPPEHNLALTAGLVGLWNANFLGIETLAMLPYAHALRSFPAWLQQLEMESNGKRCLRDGKLSAVHTAPIVWGGAGTVGQHAFHQLLYQGTRQVALDFVVPVGADDERSRMLVDNALAQSAALMRGRDLAAARASLRARGLAQEEVIRLAPHLVCPGNQPSTTLLLPELDPYRLGQLMALYEHKVFVAGWILGINSFDQYGVELGKDMARTLAHDEHAQPDPSTAALIAAVQALRKP